MGTVRFGTSSEFVSFTVPRDVTPECWIGIDVEIAVHGFRGAITASVETEDLSQFLQHLREMATTLQGAAELRPREEQFVLELAADGRGHIHVKGDAWSRARYENRLEFELEIDQTFLNEPIRVLEAALHSNGDNDA